MLIHCKPYNSSHRWLAVADLHTSPVITIDIQQKPDKQAVRQAVSQASSMTS
jgi:hypothetical protein